MAKKKIPKKGQKEKLQNTTKTISSPSITTVIEKGCAIDEYLRQNFKSISIVEDKEARFNGQGFDVMLNYTSLTQNSNKFYKMQVIEQADNENEFQIRNLETKISSLDKDNSLSLREKSKILNNLNEEINSLKAVKYFVFFRWGRTGSVGQINIIPCKDKQEALELFVSKFNSKTNYGYKFIPIQYEKEKEVDKSHSKDVKSLKDNETKSENTFQKEVKDLLNLIFDIKILDDSIKEIKYNNDMLPLGFISKELIDKGFDILQQIEVIIEKLKANKSKGSKRIISNNIKKNSQFYNKLNCLSTEFYSIIPYNFGFFAYVKFGNK